MATVLSGIIVQLGENAANASATTHAFDSPFPYVSWLLPAGFVQRRFSVKIANAEAGGTAFTTSGPVTSSDQFFAFPDGVQLGNGFAGLCTIQVALSSVLSGDFETSSNLYYFVYDPLLGVLYKANGLQIGWQAANDPDGVPVDEQRLFSLQIASDPLFTDIVYSDESISLPNVLISYAVPESQFVPALDTAYFFRVAQFDGLDWSNWSITNAFINRSFTAPSMLITSVTPLGNDGGDMVIAFTVTDNDAAYVHVDFLYSQPGDLNLNPPSLVDPPVWLPPGSHTVTWRSNRDETSIKVTGVVLLATPSNLDSTGEQTTFGPFTVDNSSIPIIAGGIGANSYSFPVSGGYVVSQTQSSTTVTAPAAGHMGVLPVVTVKNPYPVEGYIYVAGSIDSSNNKAVYPVQGRIAVLAYTPLTTVMPVEGYMYNQTAISVYTAPDNGMLPVTGGWVYTTTPYNGGEPLPVQGNHGPLKMAFFWGEDPNANPGMARRPVPTQIGGIRVGGDITRIWPAEPLGFRFMLPYWDDYNTIHYLATGSETSQYNLQIVQYLDAKTLGPWTDVIADNASYDPVSQKWLVPPLTFQAYFNTGNRSQFPASTTYQMRLRQFDDQTDTFSDWVYSGTFQLITGAPNPVSMLSMVYEPWSKWVTINFRVDNSELQPYNLINFWYSTDNGTTWLPIASGDIGGDTVALSSDPGTTGLGNFHTIQWMTSPYNLLAGDNYVVKIEAQPTAVTDGLVVPYFTWYVPQNPVGDQAKNTIALDLGSVQNFSFDATTNQWVPLATPVITSGLISLDQIQLQEVKNDPSPATGYYSFYDDDGNLTDPTGLATWLNQPYQGTQSHGQAINAINIDIDNITNGQLPSAYAAAISAEVYCRKNLINQGYYAEQFFNVDSNGIVTETVTTYAVVNVNNNTSAPPAPILRYWRFYVQSQPDGPTGIFDENGFLAPTDLTPLEQVFNEVDLDANATFDSQPYGTPLRSFLFNYNGARLSMAQYNANTLIEFSNPAVDVPAVAADTQFGSDYPSGVAIGAPVLSTTTSTATTIVLGGELKIAPAQLPGQVATDVLPVGITTWGGQYNWRVCSYNIIEGPIQAAPRPLINTLTIQAANNSVFLDYEARAHDLITSMSLTAIGGEFAMLVSGYQVSIQTTTPMWTDIQPFNYVSDRRLPLTATPQINTFPWIPRGTNRPRPSLIYDNELMQYVGFTAKLSYNNLWRPISFRSMDLPLVCEYENYWDSRPETAIYAPYLLNDGTQYLLYVTAQNGGTPYLMLSTSSDADTWSDPIQLNGLDSGAFPTVVFQGGVYYLWYEALDTDSRVKIFFATSPDGETFTQANGGAAVYGGNSSGSVGAPSVVWINGSWVMYVNDTTNNCIVSVYSSDGINWSGYKVELMPGTMIVDGSPTYVVPINPCAYLDRYQGNLELFLAFNYQLPSGECRVYRTRLEDRIWQPGVAGKIYGTAGNLVNVAATRGGTPCTCAVDMVANNIAAGADVKIRLLFTNWSPTTNEFHRQSEWVDVDNAADSNSVLEPDPWNFDTALVGIPYLQVAP